VASSSRRNVAKAALLSLLGLAGAAAFAEFPRALTRAATRRPHLWVRDGASGDDADSKPDAEAEWLARAAWLCAATLPSSAWIRLLEDVGQVLDSLEARGNPFAIDLSDEDAAEVERRVAREILPIWSAARALSASGWQTGDGAFRVAIRSADITPPSGVTAFELWSEASATSMPAGARFAAWALTGSRLRVVDAKRQARIRERVLRPDSAVALVIDAAVLDVSVERVLDSRAVTSLMEFRERVSRLDSRRLSRGGATAEIFRAFGGGLPPAPLFDWLTLEPDQVLIVPKLRFAAQPERLEDELDKL
jgi:hypothetical protein